MKKAYLFLFIIALSVLFASSCDSKTTPANTAASELEWLNWHDTVSYVGIEVCSSCHGDVRHTFQHTGMGMSFGKATKEKAYFDWDGSEIIHDTHSGFSYKPYFRGEQLLVLEFKLEGADTIHKRIQAVEYIIGSGQHTNSHIWDANGYLFQAPFTYYTQQGRADLPPGFEDGANSRFSRKIGIECMSCHNAMPKEFVLGSENKFDAVPLGIDCERCHGPGELHVARRMSGWIPTSDEVDKSIVNPRRLPEDRQVEICQRCHLQGNAVLKEGKSFFDFKPGMLLSDVMDVYLPRYDDSDESFIMASHVDRLKQSQCVIHSDESFNCISCHNPHVSVQATNIEIFNAKCASCHSTDTESKICSELEAKREVVNDNCVSCHMPVSSSEDIPHVTVHDHKIQIPQEQQLNRQEEVKRVLRSLVAINNANPSNRSRAMAFIQQVEKFGADPVLLDSAWKYISRIPESDRIPETIQIYHLKGASGLLVNLVERIGSQKVLDGLIGTDYANIDAWTAYRIGEAYSSVNQVENARAYYRRAVELAPFVLEFENKFGATSLKMGDIAAASVSFERIISENPYAKEAYGNLGYVQLLYGDTAQAIQLFESALNLDPEYEPAMLNLISSYMFTGRNLEAKVLVSRLVRRYPNNEQYRAVLEQLNTRL